MSIADFVQGIKGSSAHYVNHLNTTSPKFGWQCGYGIFSLGSKQLDQAVEYVRNQKTHHQQKTTMVSLERDHHEEDGPTLWNNGEAIAGIKTIVSLESEQPSESA